ncbi:MAG: DUF2975 domain-containing protein [Bacteroidota bacterium]
MRNYKILSLTKIILNIYWYLQILLVATIIVIGLFLLFDVQFIDINHLKGFKVHFSKITFSDPLVYNGAEYDFTLTNGEGRLHIDDLDQKFIYLRMLAALTDSLLYLMIIYFLRRVFKNLTQDKYFVTENGRYIKYIAISIILLAIVPETIYLLTDSWIKNVIDQKDVIMTVGFSLDFQTILLGLLVFVISIIFLRGIELKEDQDLTI